MVRVAKERSSAVAARTGGAGPTLLQLRSAPKAGGDSGAIPGISRSACRAVVNRGGHRPEPVFGLWPLDAIRAPSRPSTRGIPALMGRPARLGPPTIVGRLLRPPECLEG